MVTQEILDALTFVHDAHTNRSLTDAGRFRKNILIPYTIHLTEVFKRIVMYGFHHGNRAYDSEDVRLIQLSSLGHDLFEDTNVTYEEIVAKWGVEVADVILEVTRKSGDDATKLQKWEFLEDVSRGSDTAIMIKIADRYCNVMDYTMSDYQYAAKYALQAFPIFIQFRDTFGRSDFAKIHKDVDTMDDIIRTRYDKSYFDMEYDEVKELVT